MVTEEVVVVELKQCTRKWLDGNGGTLVEVWWWLLDVSRSVMLVAYEVR